MKKLNRLFALMLIVVSMIVLAACSSGAGVEGIMTYKASTNKITITCTFVANSKLESGEAVPAVRQYHYDSDGNAVSDDIYQKISFDTSNTVASVEFKGLERATKYLFKLYVTYDSQDEYITELEAKTLNYDDDAPLEIYTADDFNKMDDDPDGNYILKNDIDFSGQNIENMFGTEAKAFTGKLNGDGHKLSNFKLTNNSNSGIFGYTKEATIENLIVENGEATSLSGTVTIGTLIGYAKSTTVNNVSINNIKFTANGSSNAEENIGGVVGYSYCSTYNNVSISGFELEFTRIRQRVNAGLFAGVVSGDSVGKIKIDEKEQRLIADACMAKGSIKGVLYFPSTSSDSESFVHIGGFAGLSISKSLITNSYCEANIDLSKNTSTTYSNDYDLVVGGFLGLNEGGAYINITKSFANTNITVSSGDYVTSETSDEAKDALMDVALVGKARTASIGGFAGRFNKSVSSIKDCYYIGDINIYASRTRLAVDSERPAIEKKLGHKISEASIGENVTISSVLYEITGETYYFTLNAEEATVVDQAALDAGTYYTLVGNDYVLATEYDAEVTYYNVYSAQATVNEDTKFNGNIDYYTFVDDVYKKASEYTPKEITAYYLLFNEDLPYGYSYTSEEQYYDDAAKLSNLAKLSDLSDLTIFDEFVVNYINSLE